VFEYLLMIENRPGGSLLQLTFYLLSFVAFLVIIPIDFPFVHTHSGPRYHEDDHDVCRSLGWMFGVLLAWYATIMALLLKNHHAMQQAWAHRLVIYPNLIVAVMGLLSVYILYWSFQNHSEEAFTYSLGFINGIVMLVICACR
jgi:hypothetical protein